jgi:peptidoglycan/LPS O-acetylase OafA/YrhL
VTGSVAADPVSQPRLDATFPALDALRLVGALGVLITHTAFWAGAYTEYGAWGSLLARLDVGVAIFFVLSGFLLSRTWLARAHAGLPAPSIRHYFRKRVLRIFPVYLVTAVVALSLIRVNQDLGVGRWTATLTLTDIYVRDVLPAGLTQMWSLATEVAFYCALPLLMLAALGRRRRLVPARVVVVLLMMCLTSLLWLGTVSQRVPGAADRAVNEWLPAFLGWFAIGIGLALVHQLHSTGTAPPWLASAIERLAATPGTCWTIALGLLLVATTPVAGPTLLVAATQGEAVTKHLLYGAVGGLLVFTGVFAAGAPGYLRLMSHPLLRHLGHISYGVFCIHLPLLHLVMWTTGYELFRGHGLQIFGLTLVLSLVAAELLYRLVERPAMRLRTPGSGSTLATTTAETVSSTR